MSGEPGGAPGIPAPVIQPAQFIKNPGNECRALCHGFRMARNPVRIRNGAEQTQDKAGDDGHRHHLDAAGFWMTGRGSPAPSRRCSRWRRGAAAHQHRDDEDGDKLAPRSLMKAADPSTGPSLSATRMPGERIPAKTGAHREAMGKGHAEQLWPAGCRASC